MPSGTGVEEIRQRGDRVICAADQRPFDLESRSGVVNTFCVLTPLMTESGVHLRNLQEEFPNRGRVWWMLRPDIDPAIITPGMIWTVHLENAIDEQLDRPDKDHFQARRKDAEPGARRYVEIIDLDEDPDPQKVLEGDGISFTHVPLSRVVLRGPGILLGPWHADWQARWGENEVRVRLSATDAGMPKIWRVRRSLLPSDAVHEFSFTGNAWSKEPVRQVRVALMHEKSLALLKEQGEEGDAASDQQVVNWGIKLLGTGKRDRQVIRDLLAASSRVDVSTQDAPPGRLDRFRRILESSERVLALGEEVAALVAQNDGLKELVEKHVATIASERIQQEVVRRGAEIEQQVDDLVKRQERTQKQLEQLEKEYQVRVQEQEAALEREHERRLADLGERERAVERAEEQLKVREAEIEARLDRVLTEYRERAEELGDRILAEMPVLGRLGLGGGPRRPARSTTLRLPVFLDRPRDRIEVKEREFIEQLAKVVKQRGYVFDPDDLVNFHVSVKTGLWTVLAGPSGTGKSSLPRLYAEALGVSDELLWVPVRPDWMDDRDVLGAFNALSGRYEPAACGLVDRLIAAEEDRQRGRGGLYLVCLDEMNLSRVEHYFAQILSIIELPPERRRLSLFAQGLEQSDDPYASHRVVRIPETVRFIGTVNIDETTHFFSPKVVDRTSLLILEEPGLGEAPGRIDESTPVAGLVPVHWDVYASWIRPPRPDDPAKAQLLKIDEVLRHHRLGLGFRAQARVLAYVASSEGLLSPDRAFDLAFSQIVLPRLRATVPYYGELLEKLAKILPTGRFPRAADLLERLMKAQGEYDFFQIL